MWISVTYTVKNKNVHHYEAENVNKFVKTLQKAQFRHLKDNWINFKYKPETEKKQRPSI